MKVLVVSDSHGRTSNLEKVLEEVKPDMLIHLGDLEGSEIFIQARVNCPVEMVPGNNDYFSELKPEKLIKVGPYKVFITHGHRYGVHYGTDRIKEWARSMGADIVMFGHTHLPLLDESDSIVVLNPGSITLPRQEGRIPTYAIMEIDKNGVAHFTLNYVK